MPSAIPDRYNLEVRIGRDEDIEEWLATDISLDRPVLIRSLGPETSSERRREFVDGISKLAPVPHAHLLNVYAVEEVPGGAYAVLEWTGGSTLADHVDAGRTIDLADFLPNAAGLAGAIAALHRVGTSHGSIDLTAISYSVAHPSKLGGYGRKPRGPGDVPSLAIALETALTGVTPGGPPPSERIDGMSPHIDRILRAAQTGEMSADELEKALTAAPTPRAPAPEPRAASRRLLYGAIALVALAAGLVGLGFVFAGESNIPVLPVDPPATTTTIRVTTSAGPVVGGIVIVSVGPHDPFGEGGENDADVGLVVDGNDSTTWSTESYRDELALIKPGVGLVFTLQGTPARIEVDGVSPGARYELRWSTTSEVSQSELIVAADATGAPLAATVAQRRDGHWFLWFTDLPQGPDGDHRAEVAEVRFVP